MAINNKITTTDLDFDTIKTNLKTYLQGQTQFEDYDFEGSGLSILLDVLAYNTHYNALYTNLAINEAFLDSASKRASVVSKAKELGYVPRSARCAKAVVDVVVTDTRVNAPSSLEIPRYTPFTTKVDGVDYTFYTLETHIAYNSGTTYTFSDVEIIEGSVLQYSYVYDGSTPITIPNAGADLSTLRVTVQPNAQSSNFTVFTRSDTLIDVDGTSTVYFVKELENQTYQVEFGNDIVGKALDIGSVVTLYYVVGNTTRSNGAASFAYSGPLSSTNTVITNIVTAAYGGAEAEDINSIKWNAPRQFATQNRCVTLDDYKTIVKSRYANVEAVNVWGGEQNDPPSYGDVYVSVKPYDGVSLSAAEREYIASEVLGDRKIITIHPKFVDPTYLYLDMNVAFYYDVERTNKTAKDLTAIINNVILNYNNTYLDRFDGVFRHSHLMRLIDQADSAITHCNITFHIHRPVPITFNQAVDYIINLGNPIYNSGVPEESVMTSGFYTLNVPNLCYIDDIPTEGNNIGALRMFYYSSGQKVEVKKVGTVNYDTGRLEVNNIIVTGTDGTEPQFMIKTQSYDVVSVRNQIVSIPADKIHITAVANTTADSYKFISSRN